MTTSQTIKENQVFRLMLKKTQCLRPEGLNNIEFVGEQLKDGVVVSTNTYQFFMEDQELKSLSEALVR